MISTHKNRLYEPSWRSGISLLDASFCGQPFGKHSHDAFAIGVMTSGVGGYQSGGSSYTFPQHSLSLMNPDQPHNGYALQGPLEYKMLYVSEEALTELLPGRVRHGFIELDPIDTNGLVQNHFDEIVCRMAHRHHKGWELAVDSTLTDILDLVFIRYGRERLSPASTEHSKVARVREYLDTLAEPGQHGQIPEHSVTLKDLAAMVGLHPNYLLDSFRKVTGVAPYRYYVQRRVHNSVKLLAQGHRSTDVAQRMGFYDQSHFSRNVKQILGVTPRQITSF